MFKATHVFVAGLGLLTSAVTLAQQDRDSGDEDAAEVETLDSSGQRCLSLASIRRTEVIDDETIVFHARGGDTYINQLPRTCPGLARNDRFMYEVDIARLCSTDWITVLERTGGIGPSRGFTCRLGEFFAIEADTLAMIKSGEDGFGGRGTVEMNPIELPPEDSEDIEDAEAKD